MDIGSWKQAAREIYKQEKFMSPVIQIMYNNHCRLYLYFKKLFSTVEFAVGEQDHSKAEKLQKKPAIYHAKQTLL